MQHNYNTYPQQKEQTIKLLKVQIFKVHSNNEKLQEILSKHQQTIINMKSTPIEIQERKRSLAHIETLVVGGDTKK